MVLTFVIEDPLSTDYGRNSSSPEAPLGHTVTGGVRQRSASPEIEPFDWEFQETLRYFFEVVEPDLSPEARRLRPSDVKDPNFPRQIFYANILPKPEKSRLSPILAFTMQINTTCPAGQQIKGSDDFTDEEIRTLIAFDPNKVEPCPVEFHLARLRVFWLSGKTGWEDCFDEPIPSAV
ncbi:hypothetical protein LMH87_007392 [Akanthomyces muscarius]|uniref:Uncharacterized protein n=1 Tax=Akanthomyces muscarius TaxID=2231603 RepID=A0A9W8UU51_AKAMU|nr:hypothetical protein LMH87_007392 [Akanthomyces muscarius]KAJ4165774.1 hypothetical protein LMH87_007392 [Akanthomyces muscarius]